MAAVASESSRPQSRARRFAFTAWAAALSTLVGLTFVGVTALTVGLWLAVQNTATNPVLDLGFFALGGGVITVGLAAQIREPVTSGLWQALVGLFALALAGLIGDRIEPMVGGLAFLAAAGALAALHPSRRDLLAVGRHVGAPLALLSALVAVPAVGYAATMLGLARQAGPSCFLGGCAYGDRLAEMAALAIAVVLCAFSAAARPSGWQLTAWCVALSAALVGAVSIALPEVVGSLGQLWGGIVLAWGILFAGVAWWEGRRQRQGERPQSDAYPEGEE